MYNGKSHAESNHADLGDLAQYRKLMAIDAQNDALISQFHFRKIGEKLLNYAEHGNRIQKEILSVMKSTQAFMSVNNGQKCPEVIWETPNTDYM